MSAWCNLTSLRSNTIWATCHVETRRPRSWRSAPHLWMSPMCRADGKKRKTCWFSTSQRHEGLTWRRRTQDIGATLAQGTLMLKPLLFDYVNTEKHHVVQVDMSVLDTKASRTTPRTGRDSVNVEIPRTVRTERFRNDFCAHRWQVQRCSVMDEHIKKKLSLSIAQT